VERIRSLGRQVVLELDDRGEACLADPTMATIETIAAHGPRPAGSQALDHVRDYLANRLTWVDVNIEVGLQEFMLEPFGANLSQSTPGVNIIAELPCKTKPEEIIIACAHYDTVAESPGANDNASGVAAVLHLARALAYRGVERTWRFIFFAGEEVGLQGSRHYVEQAGENLVLASCAEDRPPEIHEASRPLTELMEKMTAGCDLKAKMADNDSGSDHWSFMEAGIPAVSIFMSPLGLYHTPGDRPDSVKLESLSSVIRLVDQTARHLDANGVGEPAPAARSVWQRFVDWLKRLFGLGERRDAKWEGRTVGMVLLRAA